LLWDADDSSSAPHKISQCYNAVHPTDVTTGSVAIVQAFGKGNADSAVDLMTVNSRLRSTNGFVFDVP
jgi:hypothetical protein